MKTYNFELIFLFQNKFHFGPNFEKLLKLHSKKFGQTFEKNNSTCLPWLVISFVSDKQDLPDWRGQSKWNLQAFACAILRAFFVLDLPRLHIRMAISLAVKPQDALAGW